MQLRIWIDSRLVADGPIALPPWLRTRVTLPERVTTTGFLAVRAELSLGDQRSTLSTLINSRPAGTDPGPGGRAGAGRRSQHGPAAGRIGSRATPSQLRAAERRAS